MLLFLQFGLLTAALLVLFTAYRPAERAATVLTGLAFLLGLAGLLPAPSPEVVFGLHLTAGSFLLSSVVCFISLVIQAYSLRHFDGYRRQRLTARYFLGLTLSLLLFVVADHLLLLIGALGMSNFLLARLISPAGAWGAARRSGRLARRQLLTAAALLLPVALLIYVTQGHLSLAQLAGAPLSGLWLLLAGLLLILAALAQSAIWPFHGWLLASANAPTPVSAFMHAGLVNGGALILYKFFPLLAQLSWAGLTLTLLGALTAVLGTTWMLVQSDVKRTLTCSTMGQMGFMIMQCGLGLFPAAIAHMIWHGFFKASLFLSAGSSVKAARNRSLRLEGPSAVPVFLFGLTIGAAGAWLFGLLTAEFAGLGTTYLLLVVFCGITCAHAVMTILQTRPGLARALTAASFGLLGVLVYGFAVRIVEQQLAPLPALPLSAWRVALMAFFVVAWLLMIFRAYLPAFPGVATLYVRALRAARPASFTWSLRRGDYRI